MKVPTIRFMFARKGLSPKDGKGMVEMVITYDTVRKYVSTGISCFPNHWKGDSKRQIYVSGSGIDMELNQILLTMYQKAYKIVSQQVEIGQVDISAIPTLLKAQSVDMTFLDYIIKRSEKKNVVEYTKMSYQGFYNKLVEYGKIKFFSDITEKAIRDFDEWLHAYTWTEKDRFDNEVKRTYSQATIGSYHKNMKNFIADAVIDGYLKENVYVTKGIRIDKGKTRIDQYLTIEEIERIEKATMPTKSLSESRDLFLMQIYTGLAYIDLMTFDFTKSNIEDGEILYTGVRHKTGVEFAFVLLPKAKEILERYNYRLPKLPNQKYNIRLKLIADAAGIDKNITSHDGRRSCGYVLLNAGVPIEVVSRVLGHESIKMTESAYAKVLNKTIVAAFAKMKKGGE